MQSAQETIPPNPTEFNQHDANSAIISPGGSFLLLLSAVGSMLLYSTRKKGVRTIWAQPKALDNIPCYRCQFFNNNPYLKCTVRPDAVLSQQAVDCSDYCSRQNYKKQKFWN